MTKRTMDTSETARNGSRATIMGLAVSTKATQVLGLVLCTAKLFHLSDARYATVVVVKKLLLVLSVLLLMVSAHVLIFYISRTTALLIGREIVVFRMPTLIWMVC